MTEKRVVTPRDEVNAAPKEARAALIAAMTKREFDPEGDGYDMDTAVAAGLKADDTGHWPSRDPKTGMILKGRKHKTFHLTEEGEKKAGYKMFKGKDGRYYSQPDEEADLEQGFKETYKEP